MRAMNAVRFTFLTGFVMPPGLVWGQREINMVLRMVADEYAAVYHEGILIGYGQHWHGAFTMHRIFKLCRVDHSYEIHCTSKPESLALLQTCTTGHLTALENKSKVSVQMRKYPSNENLVSMLDTYEYFRTWHRANARCWWIFDRYGAVQESIDTFKEMVIARNQELIGAEMAKTTQEEKEMVRFHAVKSITRRRPSILLDFVSMCDNNPLDKTSTEFEHILKSNAIIIADENERRKRIKHRASKRAKKLRKRSQDIGGKSKRNILSLLNDYFGERPL